MRPTRSLAAPLAALTLLCAVPAFAQSAPAPPQPAHPPPTVDTGAPGNAAYAPLAPGARTMFNLRDADLFDAVRAVSNITGRRILVSGRVRAVRLTVYSPTPVTAPEAWQAFVSALHSNELTVVSSGGYQVIQETTGAGSLPVPVYTDRDETPSDSQLVTRVHHLRALPARDAEALLARLRSRDGTLAAHEPTNSIVIVDSGENVRRMIRVLDELDARAPTQTRTARVTRRP